MQRIALLPEGTQCANSDHLTIRRVSGHYACSTSSKMRLYYSPMLNDPLTTVKSWYMHKPCACNHMNALLGRVGKCVPRANADFVIRHLQPVLDLLAVHVGRHGPVEYSSIYKPLDAKKRAAYQRAEKVLKMRGDLVYPRDAKIKMFVKLEGIGFQVAKVNPDCRAIQFRSKEYTLALAARIRRGEHAMYAARDVLCFGPHFAKNKNPRARAKDLRELWDAGFRWVLELDASRFDAHVNIELLLQELRFICGTNWDPMIEELLRMQHHNRGSFRCRSDGGEFGCAYETRGGRMSGDANTAYGNCILMAGMLAAFGRSLGHRFAFYCDGDDSVFFHDGPEVQDVEVTNFFRGFGMSMVIENRPRTFEGIGFCQARPVECGGGWTMQRDPFKILSKIGVSHKLAMPKGRASFVRTVAMGELALSRGCPLIQPFLQRVIEVTESGMSKRSLKKVNKEALRGAYRLEAWLPKDWTEKKTLPITNEARKSFERAWGVTVEEQRHFEDRIARWQFNLDATTPGQGVDVDRWEYPWMRRELW